MTAVGGLEGKDDPLVSGKEGEGVKGLLVRDGVKLDASGVAEGGELRADPRVVEAGGDGMGLLDLAILVEEEIGLVALDDTEVAATVHSARVVPNLAAATAGFTADQSRGGTVEKGSEEAYRIGAAPDTRHQGGCRFSALGELRLYFPADHRLELPDHIRIRARAEGGADNVVGLVKGARPVPECLVYRVLEGAGTAGDRHHRRAEKLHVKDVWPLPGNVYLPHVHRALEAELCADRRGGKAVLSRPGFRDNPLFSHPPGEKRLTEGVVDLVGTGVGKPLEFDVDLCSPHLPGCVFGKEEGRRPSDEIPLDRFELLPEARVPDRLLEGELDLLERRPEHLGDVASPESSEIVVVGRLPGAVHRLFLMHVRSP